MKNDTPFSEVRKYALRRAEAFVQARRMHESALKDCRDYILPDVGQSFDRDPATVARDGSRKDSKIINCTPTDAALTLAAGMQSGLTSPSRPWFKLGVPQAQMREVPTVQRWLQDVQDLMTQVYAQSNIYNILHDIYLQLGCFGTACALVVEDDERVIHNYMLDQGSYALGTDKRGVVNSLWRTFSMTVAQLADEFGKDKLPVQLQNKLKAVDAGGVTREDDEDWQVECLIEPSSDALTLSETLGRPYRCIYWLTNLSGNADDPGRDGILAVRGYSGNPILAPRWHLPTGIYGFGPGRRAIGDCKQLQAMEADKLRALRKMVEPPLAAPDTMKGVPLNTFPGGISYFGMQGTLAGKPMIGPLYDTRVDLTQVNFTIQVVEQRIRKAFFNDLFMMLANMGDTQRMTAREVVERHEEKLIMLGPVLERLHLELLDTLIDRTFQILLDKRMLPDPPPDLQGMPLRIEYISMLAAAQRMAGMQVLGQFVSFVGTMAPAIPSVLDKIDADNIVDEAAASLGVPAGVVVSDKDVAIMRQQRAQAQAQQQQAQAMMAATQGAKNLGQSSLDPGTVLGRLAQMRGDAGGMGGVAP
jgi:hypothetical protein